MHGPASPASPLRRLQPERAFFSAAIYTGVGKYPSTTAPFARAGLRQRERKGFGEYRE